MTGVIVTACCHPVRELLGQLSPAAWSATLPAVLNSLQFGLRHLLKTREPGNTMRSPLPGLVAYVACACYLSAVTALRTAPEQSRESNLPYPTHAGYLPVQNALGSAMYYAYFEAEHPYPNKETAPIILWLQVSIRGRQGYLVMQDTLACWSAWQLQQQHQHHCQQQPITNTYILSL